jgi:hypothetical protein
MQHILLYDECEELFYERNKNWFDSSQYKKNQARGFIYYTLKND